ncbi:helix-turn-helix domain-containing protein, partial [Bacillus pumilus]
EGLVAASDVYKRQVIVYDNQNSGRLYQTLNIFLQTNGSKKETASQLYIVRQTLYHRLDKLHLSLIHILLF